MPVNEAIEAAHRDGFLTAASLMVAEPAAADAVTRARALPSLNVGLHLVVVGGRPVSDPAAVPDLVDSKGLLDDNQVRAGFRYFFLPNVRRQLAAEIRAQFEAFAHTGLPLDHVNAHKHMHLHPTVLRMTIEIGRDFGMTAVRVPNEPTVRRPWVNTAAYFGQLAGRLFLSPWLALMKRRLRRAGMRFNDYIFGLNDTGRLDADRLLPILQALPAGVSEVFSHPATRRWDGVDPEAAGYWFEREFEALRSPAIKRFLSGSDIELVGYKDL
ncbi:MAG: hopanoid biosynthesis-associated protein HpnK [Alphaproteobacteria bacterium]|nr:hopanoid biosynthesis-associated protein HpnK [Alphaproteobacteria bacterium]